MKSGRKLYHTPAGLSTQRPSDLLPLDRGALMRRAHQLAAKSRPYMPSYRAALAYGLRTAWQEFEVRRSFASLRAQVQPRVRTPAEIEASRLATRRCGASFT